MSDLKIFLLALFLCALAMAGCSSNTSSSTGYGQGSGYSINFTVTQAGLRQGGQTTLIAAVKDNQGNPVNDAATGVTFTSTLGASISTPTPIVGGISSAIYTAPGTSTSSTGTTTTATGVDQVTASYRGAFAYQSIYVYAP